jgi:signal recognition particle subunit SRP68
VQQIVNELKPKIMTSVEDYDALVTRLKSEHAGATVRPVGAQLKRWTWEGQEVQIRSPELVDILLKVQKAEERATSIVDKNNKARMARFDALLEAWTETEEIARRASEAQKVSIQFVLQLWY